MCRFISLMIIILFAFWLPIHDAQAKRFGGGRSFGVQRSASSFSRQPFQTMQVPGQRSFGSKWLGPLAGLAAGGLLASLFMQNGLGNGLLLWLGIGLVILFLVSLFRKKMQPAAQHAHAGNILNGEFSRNNNSHMNNQNPFLQSSHTPHYPAGFDADSFIRDAKVQFIRLQSAYDQKNLNDLREFTTPEIFAEVQLQLHERGNSNNQTVVVSLDAELLDVSTDPQFMRQANDQRTMASVRFTGRIREDLSEETPLNETWHFIKEDGNSRWKVAGVQQN